MKNKPRIGELFMLGFQGSEIPGWLKEFEQRFGLGGVILFDYSCRKKSYDNNIFDKQQLTQLCTEIHKLPSRPLIYVDQEGGKVRRLKDSCGFAALPSQHDLAALPETEKRAALEAAYAEMRAVGIDMNLAPVIDTHNPENPDIGSISRAYTKAIAENVALLNEVAQKQKVGLCLKHYPGIGNAIVNSHKELMDLTPDFDPENEQLFCDLAPQLFTNAMLLSHAFVKQWDEAYPVSISPTAIARIRAQLPDVLLFTDDLQMQGLQKRYNTSQACLQAISAGVDVLCIGNNLLDEEEKMIEIAAHLEHEVEQNDALRVQVEAVIKRINTRREMVQ